MVIPEMVQFWPAISTAALNKERPISAITGAIANGEINCKNIPTSPLNPTASSTSDADMIAPFNQFQNDCESDFISGIDSERFKYDQLKWTVYFQTKNRFGIHVLNLGLNFTNSSHPDFIKINDCLISVIRYVRKFCCKIRNIWWKTIVFNFTAC